MGALHHVGRGSVYTSSSISLRSRTRHLNAWRTSSARADGWGCCSASVRFRRGWGKGIVPITARNAALSRRCPRRSRTKLPEKEVGKCPCGRLYGLSVDEERIHFHRAEIPVRQHPHKLPGLELCSRAVFARRGDPQPGDGACRGSLVDGDSELAVNAHGGDAAVLAEGESRRGVRRTDDHRVVRELRRQRGRAALPQVVWGG